MGNTKAKALRAKARKQSDPAASGPSINHRGELKYPPGSFRRVYQDLKRGR